MRLKPLFIYLFLVFLLNTSRADANVESPSTSTSTTTTSIKKKIKITSREMRENKSAVVTYQIAGVESGGLFATGAMIGFLIDSDNLLQLSYTRARRLGMLDTNVDSYTFGAHLKTFISNAVYLSYGFDYRNMKTNTSENGPLSFSFGEEREVYNARSEALFPGIGIGSQWQWGLIGCTSDTKRSKIQVKPKSETIQRLIRQKEIGKKPTLI